MITDKPAKCHLCMVDLADKELTCPRHSMVSTNRELMRAFCQIQKLENKTLQENTHGVKVILIKV